MISGLTDGKEGQITKRIEYDTKTLRRIYQREGSLWRTAAIVGFSTSTCRRILIEAGIRLNQRGHPRVYRDLKKESRETTTGEGAKRQKKT